jgi:hypothetical protein
VLEGWWTAEAVPVEQIRASLLQAGVTEAEVDKLFLERGMMSGDFTFGLEFHDDEFRIFYTDEATTNPLWAFNRPPPAEAADQSGTFVYTGDRLHLSPYFADRALGHTLEFCAVMSGDDQLTLRFIDSTAGACEGACTDEEENAADHAALNVRAIAFATSSTFFRQPQG